MEEHTSTFAAASDSAIINTIPTAAVMAAGISNPLFSLPITFISSLSASAFIQTVRHFMRKGIYRPIPSKYVPLVDQLYRDFSGLSLSTGNFMAMAADTEVSNKYLHANSDTHVDEYVYAREVADKVVRDMTEVSRVKALNREIGSNFTVMLDKSCVGPIFASLQLAKNLARYGITLTVVAEGISNGDLIPACGKRGPEIALLAPSALTLAEQGVRDEYDPTLPVYRFVVHTMARSAKDARNIAGTMGLFGSASQAAYLAHKDVFPMGGFIPLSEDTYCDELRSANHFAVSAFDPISNGLGRKGFQLVVPEFCDWMALFCKRRIGPQGAAAFAALYVEAWASVAQKVDNEKQSDAKQIEKTGGIGFLLDMLRESHAVHEALVGRGQFYDQERDAA